VVTGADIAYTQMLQALEDAKESEDGLARVEPETLKQMLADLKDAAVRDFVERLLAGWDDAHGPEEADPALFRLKLLNGLRELGWSDVQPGPLYPLPVLTERISTLQHTPWSGDNTYAQGLDDAIGTLQAMYAGKSYVPRWMRCPSTKLGNPCIRPLPHLEHANGLGDTWGTPAKMAGKDPT
jgi:hypothetical protein